jgi:hypothetical protein
MTLQRCVVVALSLGHSRFAQMHGRRDDPNPREILSRRGGDCRRVVAAEEMGLSMP